MSVACAPQFAVRPFTSRDWRALWTFHAAQLAEDGIMIPPEEIQDEPALDIPYEVNPDWDLDHLEEVYQSGSGGFWLAWVGERVAGHVAAQDVDGAIELRRMVVDASYRRQGIGTALVRALIEHVRERGLQTVELWTAPDGPGRSLYSGLGFRVVPEPAEEFRKSTARVRRPNAGEIRMRLDLA